jgi:peptide/nickel transport system permease protein
MNWRLSSQRIAKRLGQSVITVIGVTILTFCLVRFIPGDPVSTLLGSQATPAAIAELTKEYHLNEPFVQQFVDFVGGLLHGNLGTSLIQGTPVLSIIGQALPVTLAVVLLGLAIGVLGGVILGLAAALNKQRGLDTGVRVWAMIMTTTPTFLVALLFILFFALDLNWFPAGGWAGQYPQNLAYLVLPSVAMSLPTIAPQTARAVRRGALDIADAQFMEAARSRGISERSLVLRHVLPNSVLPVITLVGISFGGLLTGAIFAEAVFDLPGLGAQMVSAVQARDYPVIQGIALITAVGVIVGNLLAEIVYTLVDPRARR